MSEAEAAVEVEEPTTEEPAPKEEAPKDQDTWFGDKPAAEEPDGPIIPDDGRTLPDWLPGKFQDPANRAELLQVLGISTEEANGDERPEWLPEQFKKPEDLAESYKNLRSKMDGKDGPPEVYELKLPEGVDGLPEGDAETFRAMGLSNDNAQKLMDYFHSEVVPQMAEQQHEAQRQQLASAWEMTGEDGKPNVEALTTRLAEVKTWADKNVPPSVVTEMAKTADGMRSLYSLMQSKTKSPQSSGPVQPTTKDELQQQVNDPRYWADEAFRNQVNKKYQQVFDR